MKSSIAYLLLALMVFCCLPACKKCYSCTYNTGSSASYCSDNYNNAQLAQLDTGCVHGGGVWSRASQ